MSVFSHDELPLHEVPRIKTRVLAGRANAGETAVWEQWIEADGYIPLHYHDVEEVLVFLSGDVALTQWEETTIVRAPATAVVPAGQVHGLRPASASQVHLLAVFPTASPRILEPDGKPRPMPWEDVAGGEPPP